jgi:hypothetical protein
MWDSAVIHYGPRELPVIPNATIFVSFEINGYVKEYIDTLDNL